MKLFFHRVLVLTSFLAALGCATVDDRPGVSYKAKVKGAGNNKVKKEIKTTTSTFLMTDRPPSTIGQLNRRMERDVPKIEAILEARGYYDHAVSMELERESDPVKALFRIEPGRPYRFRQVEVVFCGEPDKPLRKIKPLLRQNGKVSADEVFREEQRIIDLMKRRGYPFAELKQRKVTIDREQKKVDLLLEFDPGQLSFFGPLVVAGQNKIPEEYFRRQVPWKQGARYDAGLVRDFESKLLGSGLFGTAHITPEEAANGTNSIPLLVSVTERNPRTVSVGLNWSDIGPGGRIFWEHRNAFGVGERLETTLSWNPIEVEGEARLTRTGFLDANQSLVLDLSGSVENPDAYDAKKARGVGMVLRDFSTKVQAGGGLGYQFSRVQQLGSDERYAHILFPFQLLVDFRNDRLNPESGHQLFGQTAWYEDTEGQGSFLKSYLEGRKYLMLWEKYHLSAAVQLTGGSIDGADVNQVPADERFYAGGGGSIRGYEYQQVGPKVNGVPTGGDKLVEFSAELRLRPGNKLGYVAFVDGGTVYNDLLNETEDLRYGAGLGVRWFTTIGPLRADLAYPLNPDSTQIERLQFYISLGQAF